MVYTKMVGFERRLTIFPEIRKYIMPLGHEQLIQLEKKILSEGCRDALTVWPREDQLIIVDGHNRYKICQKHHLSFKIRKVHFKDLDEVKLWVLDNQMGRRNLNQGQMSYYRGLKYLTLKKKKGGYDNIRFKGKAAPSAAVSLSAEFNVSESTIKRDARFAQGLNNIGTSSPKLKQKILTGECNIKKADVRALSSSANVLIKNEADLYNKVRVINKNVLSEAEAHIRGIEKKRIQKAQDVLKAHESTFLRKADRLKKLKRMILIAISRAIDERDAFSIKNLKKLVDQFADLLL